MKIKSIKLGYLLATLAAVMFFTSTQAEEIFRRGQGSYVYTYAPLKDKPITIHYYIPTHGDIALMPVLFAMHGAGRHGEDPLDAWKDFAEATGFVVLCPEYSSKYYNKDAYNYGNVSKSRKTFDPQPRELWTFTTIEAIFDLFCKQTGNMSDRYDMWGHSAGGQFVHRFLLCMPDARVGRAVAANPGTWTFTSLKGIQNSADTYSWPYSVKGTPFAERENLKKFFARNLFVSLGTADVKTDSKDFPSYPEAMAQGATRYERGANFYKAAREDAKTLGCQLNWQRVDVKDSGHSIKMMVYGKYERVNGKKVYDIHNISPKAGFALIYGDRKPLAK